MSSTRSWKTPTPDEVDRAVALLAQPAQARYFFDRLNNPEWIVALRLKGYFRNPPPPIRDATQGTISFPQWPAARFLARVASERPEVVRDVILEMPPTDNVVVLEDLLQAATTFPPPIASSIVPLAVKWAEIRYQALLPERLAALIAHLARGAHAPAALRLARALFDIVPKADRAAPDIRNAEPRFGEWEYGELIHQISPVLIEYAGFPAVELLLDILERATNLSARPGQTPPEDYSYLSRPAIEDHRQNLVNRFSDILISAVRDGVEMFVNLNPQALPEVVRSLDSRPWRIFHRIALHLLRRFPDGKGAAQLIPSRLLDPLLFDAPWCRHEHFLLMAASFRRLSAEQQREILSWIDRGPDLAAFRKFKTEWTGVEATEAEVESYNRHWQRDRLAPLVADLPSVWRERYADLVGEAGEPTESGFTSPSTGFYGPASPVDTASLKTQSIDHLREFLSQWKPPLDLLGPSPEGLSRNLTATVKDEPQRFAAAAVQFRGLESTYVRGILRGLCDAAREAKVFTWEPVLDLCDWVVAQVSESEPELTSLLNRDPGWSWCRKAVADLLSTGCQQNLVPEILRDRIWHLLEILTDDADPTTANERPTGEAVTTAINSVRGEAMHGVVHYALWVRRHISLLSGSEELLRKGFREMPEVQRLLDHRLDPNVELTRAIRSVYGQYFPWLALLDHEWAARSTLRIFPLADESRDLWEAAWKAYVIFCPAYDSVLDLLRQQYVVAANRISRPRTPSNEPYDSESHLAEHLMSYYWRGMLALEVPPLTTFLENAPPKILAYAMHLVGRNLSQDLDMAPAELLERLSRLWELVFQRGQGDVDKSGIAAFGWWFISGKFDNKWAVDELVKAIRAAGTISAEREVLERLSALADRFPSEAIVAADLLVEGAREGWKIYHWREQISRIAAAVVASGEPTARRAAEEFIHRLGRRGYFDFRELLPSQ